MDLLEIKNLNKYFGKVVALENINLSFKRGEIHGLIGANGSGKSTLMNILNGEINIRETGGYQGEIYLEGMRVDIKTRQDAICQGIEMVHQELSLLESLKVVDNIKLNKENTLGMTDLLGDLSLVDREKNREDVLKYLDELGVDLDLNSRVDNLQVSQKQFVEIGRGIDNQNLKILMLDEPTSCLNIEETQKLLRHMEKLAELGICIVFVSHRLDEIVEVCDRVSILRNGRLVGQYETPDFDKDRIALDMIGTKVVQAIKDDMRISEVNILEFDSLDIFIGKKRYRDLSLKVKEGEVLGITGLAGHGYEMFPYALMGLYRREGEIVYKGRRIDNLDNKELIDRGVYLIPEDRKKMSLLMDKPVWENMVFESYARNRDFLRYPRLGRLSLLDMARIYDHCGRLVEDLNIKVGDLNQRVGELSGGNQQKVCIARARTMQPEILFIGEPTRGIDIYSKEIILNMLLDLNEKENTSLVIYSGETEELMRICNRIIVMNDHKVLGEFMREDYNTERFRLAISGRGCRHDK